MEAEKTNSSSVRSDLVCRDFGLTHEKSVWQPSNSISWIGFNIDTQTGFIFTVDPRTNKLCSDLNAVRHLCSTLFAARGVFCLLVIARRYRSLMTCDVMDM